MMLWPDGTTRRPPITSPFGPRRAPVAGATTMHRGCDFIGFALVRSVAAGRVVAVGTPRGWTGGGIQVWVQHDGFLARYMHLKNTPPIRVGDTVNAGRILGVMGRTGNVSGVHLHLEVVVNGTQIDPVPFITARITTATPAGSSSRPALKPAQSEEDDDMPKNVMHHMKNGKEYTVAISNPGSGFHLRYTTTDPKVNDAFAKQYETGDSILVDASMFRVIEEACAAVRP